jgi:hypothetical protein
MILLLFACLHVPAIQAAPTATEDKGNMKEDADACAAPRNDASAFSYRCPSPQQSTNEPSSPTTTTTTAVNYEPILFRDYETQAALTMDLDTLVATFRTAPNGDWGGLPYDAVKEGMRAWKTQFFLPHVRSGDRIYESAAGVGFNLLLTMELLAEAQAQPQDPWQTITNLTLYGNEYLPSSVTRANVLLPRVFGALSHAAGLARLGQGICQGDSTRLSNVPSDSFDVVYTGYILPLHDPLGLGAADPTLTPRDVHLRYVALCREAAANGNPTRAKDTLSAEAAQARQQDFYASWVGEMIRLAKPGAPVLVEHVSQPKCLEYADNGGVLQEWWYEAIDTYDWPIDPDSLALLDDTIFGTHRYHVFMRKTLASQEGESER